jgi:hypothetical protein
MYSTSLKKNQKKKKKKTQSHEQPVNVKILEGPKRMHNTSLKRNHHMGTSTWLL